VHIHNDLFHPKGEPIGDLRQAWAHPLQERGRCWPLFPDLRQSIVRKPRPASIRRSAVASTRS